MLDFDSSDPSFMCEAGREALASALSKLVYYEL